LEPQTCILYFEDSFYRGCAPVDAQLEQLVELALVERLGDVVVGAEAEALELVIEFREAGEDQNRGLDLGGAQALQHLIAVHVRQHEVEDDDVVIVKLADLEPVFAEARRIADKTVGLEHQFDALGHRRVILNHKNAHGVLLGVLLGVIRGFTESLWICG